MIDDVPRRLRDLERDLAVLKERSEYIHEGLEQIRGLPIHVAELTGLIELCVRDTKHLREKLDAREKQRGQERERLRVEKRSDRRWLIGTMMTSFGLLVGAAALLLNHL